MPRSADCRRCRHYRPYHLLTLGEVEECESLAEARGQECLGWCAKYGRGVTYYRGPCSGFQDKEGIRPPKVTLASFMDLGDWA